MNRPTKEEVIQYFKDKGIDNLELATLCFEYYEDGDWCDRNGEPVKNWKQKILIVWIKKERERLKKVPQVIKLKSISDIITEREGIKYGG
jgi:hypothetical protein